MKLAFIVIIDFIIFFACVLGGFFLCEYTGISGMFGLLFGVFTFIGLSALFAIWGSEKQIFNIEKNKRIK